MDAALRALVRNRARGRCEFCHLPQAATPFVTFHIEHVRARQHGGTDEAMNLALACPDCNRHKGPNLTAIDSDSQSVVAVFNPRTDSWDEHFSMRGAQIVGLTAVGRATVSLLDMNEAERLEMRAELIANRDL